MWCRSSLLLLSVGCILAQALTFNYQQNERRKMAVWPKKWVQERANLVREHREALVEETTAKLIKEDHVKSLRAEGASTNDLEAENADDNRQYRPNGPAHSPNELPIAIKPYRADPQTTVEEKADEAPQTMKDAKNMVENQNQDGSRNEEPRHRTPILNIKHEFLFPSVDALSQEDGTIVIKEREGVLMDTRPLSLRESPNPTVVERLHPLSTVCGGIFEGLSGVISSPDYPFNYPNSIRCIYKIVLSEAYTVGLDCNDFSIQPGDRDCENDFLAISDNGDNEPTRKYCGDKAISDFSSSSNMTLEFQTDGTYRYRGFMCRYRALNPDGTGAEGIVNVNSTAAEHTVICTGPGDDGWAGKCGVSNSVSRIVGGYQVRPNQFPWMVAVLKECGKDLEHYCQICGGTVIHSQWILTGAHCIVSVPVETIALLLGDHNLYTLTPSQKFFRIEAVYVHPDFNVPSPLNNDVALAKLPQNMAFNKYIAPICLPPKNPIDLLNLLPRDFGEVSSSTADPGRHLRADVMERAVTGTTELPLSHKIIHDNFDGRNITIFGWGTINDHNDISQMLRGVSVLVLPNAECDYYYGVMTDTMMCTSGAGGQGPCQGDSGSPAQMQMVDGRWIQVGVLAFGAAYGCEVGYPSGNVLLPFYVDWIEFVTGFDFSEYY